jgi:threonine/homoserine/homoserine lactone efflux protein
MAQDLTWFLAATLALNLTPGPDMVYVSARSLAQGTRAGIVSALGIAAGCVLQAGAVALGLARLLAAAPALYRAIRIAGAVYLLYLGARTIVTPRTSSTEASFPREPLRVVFLQGMLTNLLNPKVAIFFLAFLPQFVDPEAEDFALRVLFLGALFNLSGTSVNAAVAIGAGLARRRFQPSLLRVLSGIVLLGLGASMLVLELAAVV